MVIKALNLVQASFFTTLPGIIVIIAVVIALAIIIYLWVRVTTKKQRYLKAIQALDKDKTAIQAIPVTFKLLKLEKIGQNNVVYAEVHREYKKSYDEVVTLFLNEYKSDYAMAKRELADKNYRKLAETIKGIQIKLAAFRDKMNQLSDQIDMITKDEDETKVQEAELKSKSRECYEKYQRNHHELEILQEEFKEFFHRIDDKFQTYEDYIQRGSYTDAKEVLMMIKDNLEEIDRQLEVAPRYTILVTRVIPQRINEVIDKYNEMQENGFPLYHILANSAIGSLKEDLLAVVNKLKAFQYNGINEEIEGMSEDISRLNKQLEEEKEARTYFDQQSESIYDKAEALERGYIKHMKQTAEVKKSYEVNEERLELDNKIKIEVQRLSVIRRSLDALNYGQQPYSLRIVKLKDLENQVQIVEDCMSASVSNLESMKDHAEYAYGLVEDAKYRLKKIQLELRNSKHEKIVQDFIDEFNYGQALIEKLDAIVKHVPIDIAKVQSYSTELTQLLTKIEQEGRQQLDDAEYAEKLLMYANNFRPSYSDVARDVSKAEIYFYDGKFADAISITKDAISRFPLPASLERVEKK